MLLALCLFVTSCRLDSLSECVAPIDAIEQLVTDDSYVEATPVRSTADQLIDAYQNTWFNAPLSTSNNASRVPTQGFGGHAPAINKLLMRDGLLCQSSPKRPYSIQLLTSKAHSGAAKTFYVYALQRLVI